MIYWIGLKSDKFNFHSTTYNRRAEAIARLNEFSKADRKDLKIYSVASVNEIEIDQIIDNVN